MLTMHSRAMFSKAANIGADSDREITVERVINIFR
jgi:hypothetical protein